jgi:cell division septum initiation protein DivIVA
MAADELRAAATSKRDQMLAEATSQRDQLLAAATAKRDEMLTEARERSTGMVAEAQQKKAAVLEELEKQKSLLDKKIAELHGFERSYRTNLKSYIQAQLSDLEKSSGQMASAGSGHSDGDRQH